MTAMHHEPVADRLGIPTHPLPPGWRQGGGGGGGKPPRSGCALLLLALLAVAVLAVAS